MNARICITLLLLVFGAFFQQDLHAQSDSVNRQKVVVVMNNGVERTGYIISDDGRELLLETANLGRIFIKKSDIKRITPLVEETEEDGDERGYGEYAKTGPFTTRYYFTTNALPIKKRENYALVHLYGPEVHFAVTDRLSVGVMSTWIASPIALAVKYSIPTDNKNINWGVGTIIGSGGYLQPLGYGALHWGMLTLGDRQKNVTFSLGYSYINPGRLEEVKSSGVYKAGIDNTMPTIPSTFRRTSFIAPAVGIAGIYQVGEKASLFVDAMVFAGQRSSPRSVQYNQYDTNGNLVQVVVSADPSIKTTFFYLMPGMRFQRSENKAFQVALAGVTIFRSTGVRSFPIPTCSWLVKF